MVDKMYKNAHKIAYLAGKYPDHTIAQIISLVQLPSIDVNAAIWHAIDLGLISKVGDKGEVKRLKGEIDTDGFDYELKDTLLYCFKKLALEENDMEEMYLSRWTAGYPSHDVLIALSMLEDEKQIAQYEIEDGENTYTFFTLYKNRDKLWGRKQFKEDPLGEEEK